MHKLELPSQHFSYSQWTLWEKDKPAYRRRYYEKLPSFVNKEMIFGKKIAERLEKNDPTLSFVPQLPESEHRLTHQLGRFTFLAFLDSFNPHTNEFYEYKTGKVPWNDVKVRKHTQLDVYSMLIKEKYGDVTDECTLLWLPTKDVEPQGLATLDQQIALTGECISFTRKITDEQRKRVKQNIILAAEEIAVDYALWKKTKQQAN